MQSLSRSEASAVDVMVDWPEPATRLAGGLSVTRRLIGVLVVGSHRLFAGAVRGLLEGEADMAVIGHTSTVAEARTKLDRANADVVILDVHLADGSALDVGKAVRAACPGARLILVTDDDGDTSAMAAVEAGAVALIQWSRAGAELVDAVRAAASGEVLIPPQRIASILSRKREIEALRKQITPREMEALRLLGEGVPTRQMADRLGVSYATVRTHIYNLCKRLGAHSKLEVVARARALGLI